VRAVFVLAYRVCPVSNDILMCMREEQYILYKEDGLRLVICAHYLWEMLLNVCLRVWFDNMYEWNGNQGKEK
jgi:hypothetical protein